MAALATGVQDAACAARTGDSRRPRLVPPPAPPADCRPAHSARASHSWTLQLLRSEWQQSLFGASAVPCQARVVQVASPSEPTSAAQLEAVYHAAAGLSASLSSGGRAHLGVSSVSRVTGGAGWWKSPCPDLARASAGKPAEATRQPFITEKVPEITRRAHVLFAEILGPKRQKIGSLIP